MSFDSSQGQSLIVGKDFGKIKPVGERLCDVANRCAGAMVGVAVVHVAAKHLVEPPAVWD